MEKVERGSVWRPPEEADDTSSSDEDFHCDPQQNNHSDTDNQEQLNFNFQLNLDESNSGESSTGGIDVGAAGQTDATDSDSSWERHRVSATQESGVFEPVCVPRAVGMQLETDDVNSLTSAVASEEERRQSREERRRAGTVTVSDAEIRNAISHLSTANILRYVDDSSASSSATSCGEVRRCKLKTMPHCQAQVCGGCEGFCGEHYATLVRSNLLKPNKKLVRKVRKQLMKRKTAKQDQEMGSKHARSQARAKTQAGPSRQHVRPGRSASARMTPDARRRSTPKPTRRTQRDDDVIESGEESNKAGARRKSVARGRRCIAPHCDAALRRGEESLCSKCLKVLQKADQGRREERKEMKREVRQARVVRERAHAPDPAPNNATCCCQHYVPPRCGCRSCQPRYERPQCNWRRRHDISVDGASDDDEDVESDAPSSLMSDCQRPSRLRLGDSGNESHSDVEACRTPGCNAVAIDKSLCADCHRR